jgi:hypothetical protein
MKKRKKREDENQAAARVVAISTGQPIPARKKNPAAVALGLLGGSKGGKKRAENLSPEQRRHFASVAARARWAKKRAQD